MNKLKISVFTCSRSDFGLLQPICKKILTNNKLKLEIFCTGTHFSKNFGLTINEFPKYFKKNLIFSKTLKFLPKNKDVDIASYSTKIKKDFSNYLKNSKPEIVLLLGDRYETLEAATCAYNFDKIIIHFHGGEKTYGSKDDSIRHAISKLSNYHFVSTKKSKKRLIQLGEEKKNIFVVGPLSLENIKNQKFIPTKILENQINFKFFKKNILISLHPDYSHKKKIQKNVNSLINSLKNFKNIGMIFTSSGADYGGDIINKSFKNFCKKRPNCKFIYSLGSKKYLSILKNFNLIVGNSSSGFFEAPFLKCYTINLGKRQQGRELAFSVVNIPYEKKKITQAIKKFINKSFYKGRNPYKLNKNPSDKIIKLILNLKKNKSKKYLKNFVDII